MVRPVRRPIDDRDIWRVQHDQTALDLEKGLVRDIGRDRLLRKGLGKVVGSRSEEHTSELQSLMRISYAVFCLKKKTRITNITQLTSPEYTAQAQIVEVHTFEHK